ncbi:MAG TPA: sigma-70 family RNA polymerase sigma factor [Verrucomicrobiae bacterium]|nr:sigma-70 family RNA polymerase sigma factor [Verrucomicrobiae bacterium]
MTDSQTPLAEYAANGSDPAFRELVRRYIDLVFSTALRLVGGDSHRAQDVVQLVFLDLARNARRLAPETMLGGWLHRDTCFVASKLMRSERRRQRREQQAAEMRALNQTNDDLARVAPVLDEAINELREEDRTAILLRFYEKRDLRSIGEALGSSENAAQKRVTRALGELHALLTRRGVVLSAASLGAVLAGGLTTSAPAGLAASVSSSALAGCATVGGIALGALHLFTMTKLKMAAAFIIAGLGTALLVQHQSIRRAEAENAALGRRLEELRAANQAAQAAANKNQPEPTRRAESELMRLRGEVTTLRRELQSVASRGLSTNSAQNEPGPNTAPGRPNTLHANIRTEIPDGQTLLTGGWSTGSGSRVFVLATPTVLLPDGNAAHGDPAGKQVNVKTRVLEVPDTLLTRVGLGALTVEGDESSSYNVLARDQLQRLLNELAAAGGTKVLSESSVTTLDARQAEIQTVDDKANGATENLSHTINVLPVISSDKSAIELTLDAGLTKPAIKAN